jgi:hypothetical protein
MIGSRHKLTTGSWVTYAAQKNFTMRRDDRLSVLLLPAEFGGAVYVFERNTSSSETTTSA